MTDLMNRRDLLKLAGMGVAVFISGTTVRAPGSSQKKDDSFYFVQLSDTHWGFNGPAINPDSQGTLKKAVLKGGRLLDCNFYGRVHEAAVDRVLRRLAKATAV